MKKTLSLLCALLVGAAMTTACAAGQNTGSSASTSIQETTAATAAVQEIAAETTADTAAVQESAPAPAELRIAALKGPTAMGMVHFMDQADSGNLTDNHYHFSIASSIEEINPLLAKGELDIAALPANVASVLYNKSKDFQVLAINTLGVLYIVESGDSLQSLEDLRGKTLLATGKGATPEYVLNYLLQGHGLDPAKDVSIEWKSEPAECLAALMAQENAIAMLPQPFVTTAQTKSDKIRVALDLTQAWDALQQGSASPSSLITGVVVARRAFVEENPQAVSAFMDHYKQSVEFVQNHVEEAAQLVGKYDIVPAPIAQKALPACNITFIEGEEMKQKLSGYLSALLEQNPQSIGGALPEDGFYFVR